VVKVQIPQKHPAGAGCGKRGMAGEFPEEAPPALKPRVDSAGFMRWLKPPPPSVSSLSAAGKARLSFSAICGMAEAVPLQSLTFTTG
jgi:hypothetical protein